MGLELHDVGEADRSGCGQLKQLGASGCPAGGGGRAVVDVQLDAAVVEVHVVGGRRAGGGGERVDDLLDHGVGDRLVAAGVGHPVEVDEEVSYARVGAPRGQVDVDEPVAVGVGTVDLPDVGQPVAVAVLGGFAGADRRQRRRAELPERLWREHPGVGDQPVGPVAVLGPPVDHQEGVAAGRPGDVGSVVAAGGQHLGVDHALAWSDGLSEHVPAGVVGCALPVVDADQDRVAVA